MTAILGSNQPKDAADTVRRYAETRPHRQQSGKKLFAPAGIDELAKLSSGHSFVDALEALIASAQEGSLAKWMAEQLKGTRAKRHQVMPLIEIAASSPGTIGDIRIAGVADAATAQVRYTPPGPWNESKQGLQSTKAALPDESGADLAQYRSVTARTIFRVADLLAQRGKYPND